ncbi:MAG: hypothetical protein HC930_16430 [Hydrococcus sp. SU_1_0]|nr:hypothetical protein [Hydrococcus sp. SU_1_0]
MTDAQNTPEPNQNKELTLKDLGDKIDDLSKELKTFDEKFKNYQQATQWVVQLAFTLIASATVTVILTSVVNNR